MKKKKRDFLGVYDFSHEEIYKIFETTEKLKKQVKRNRFKKYLKNKTLGMIFEKTSTRTRVSFEVGMSQLGGNALFLSKNDIQLNKGETIYDTAKVLSRFVDAIMIRTFAHENVVNLAQAADVPVINGLSDLLHPCQAMADFFTVFENKPELKRNPDSMKLTFIGDGNNVANSLFLLSAIIGNTFCIANPKGYGIPKQIQEMGEDLAKKSGAKFIFEENPIKAAKDADVLYTDVWVSMGQEKEKEEKVAIFKDYQINQDTLKEAKTDSIVLHCLPANRGMEITDEVMDGPHSRVFDEAENRMHVQKAILLKLLKK
ncbi:MAG TPA: ornithine carbamoyltransferase [Spirochaetia bacterium]|nr:MAG: ornithine carbamoyltransferase [Spirochaetes bacterium GWB1_36_13]HCL57690.1 ornithine carbamoyltransferase [Spirochaetia bacterium]